MRPGDAKAIAGEKSKMLSRTGSFWYTNTTPETRDYAKNMVTSHILTTAVTGISATPSLVSESPYVALDNVPLRVGPEYTQNLSGDKGPQLPYLTQNAEQWYSVYASPGAPDHPQWACLYEQEGLNFQVLSTELAQFLLWPNPEDPGTLQIKGKDLVKTWAVWVPGNMLVSRIQKSDGQWMIRGIDFQSEHGVVLIYEDPGVLWKDLATTVCGYLRPTCPYSYTLQLDGVSTTGWWVMNYYRNSRGLNSFRRALAEASGLHVCYRDSYIVKRQLMPVGATYWTQYEEIRAWYPHELLSENNQIYRGDIVGVESMSVVENAGDLSITLLEPLFDGMFKSRALEFIHREKPLGAVVNVSIVQV